MNMKKVLLLMAMLTIGLASINAQDNLRWGATVGMNSSNFSITGFDSKIGFHAGVKAEVGLPARTTFTNLHRSRTTD